MQEAMQGNERQGESSHYPDPDDEERRLEALAQYFVLDTPPEEDLDRLARVATRIFSVPIALVSMVDRARQFFKARIGLDVSESSRAGSFCSHAILNADVLLVADAAKDPRFRDNPLVVGPPYIRFYAGKPLVTPTGEKIGTICLIDTKPRHDFTAEDRMNLADMAERVMDRLEVRRLGHARSVSQARFDNIAGASHDAIICSNLQARITYWNRAAEQLFGYGAHEALGQCTGLIVHDSWRQGYEAELEQLRNGFGTDLDGKTIELRAKRKDGSEFLAEFSLSTWKEGISTSVGAIIRDVTERRLNEERLSRLASLDALTDLPNRASWRARLDKTMQATGEATVLLLDLDGFKEVNDTLGHSAGDALLIEVAARLKASLSMAISVGRLGGDEFVALLPGNDERQARAIAGLIISAFASPFEHAGRKQRVGVSVGVALAPQHGESSQELMNAADLALYRAKAAGKGHYEVFEPQLRQAAISRREFEAELRLAFERGEFELFYQPQFTIAERRLTGAEALIRWNHPQRGLLTPAVFMDVLRQKRSAAAIGEWILRTACEQAARWRKIMPAFRVGVNLFEAQFRSGRLLASVRESLEHTGLDPEGLELEIVENVLLQSDDSTVQLLEDLRALGVGLAFDDYGTGFASLSLLKRYPVTRLKIDRSFVRDVTSDAEDAAIVRALLYLGESFGVSVIAEGVETEEQLSFLKHNHCTEAQGYLLGRPVPAGEFQDLFLSQEAGAR